MKKEEEWTGRGRKEREKGTRGVRKAFRKVKVKKDERRREKIGGGRRMREGGAKGRKKRERQKAG